MNSCSSLKIPIISGILKPFAAIGLVLIMGCSVPAAPQQPFAGRNLGSDDECKTTTKTPKKTTSKKSVGLVDKKKTKDEDEEDDSSSQDCDDKPSTANSTGTTPLVNNGVVTPGQTTPVGTLPTAVTPVTPTPAAAPTYATAIKAYLDQACTSCHNGGLFKPGPNLNNYADAVKNAANSLTTMKAGTMPKSNKASDAEIKTFEAWIAGGSLQ